MPVPDDIIGVAELDRRLKRAVETVTGREWIEGELSSLKLAPSGHAYFTLRDEEEDAVIDCVMYRFNAMRARRFLKDGARVQVRGKATLWAPRGRLQFVCETLRQAGRGALLEALEQLKLRLAEEGLFAPERKRPLPPEPRIVGLVTSPSGAAFHDIRTVAFRRGNVRLVLSPARVQGEAAPDSIVRALDLVERYPGVDVIIVGRGGGSGEDLMAFNDERVVRRIAAMRVPIVSAVGHEIDITLSDLVADARAATPSEAAELSIPDAKARRDVLARAERLLTHAISVRVLAERSTIERMRAKLGDPRFVIAERQQALDETRARVERLIQRSLARRRGAVVELDRRLSARHPRAVLAESRARIQPLEARLHASVRARLQAARNEISRRVTALDALSPLSVLGRGYAIALAPDGRALRSAEQADVGDELTIILSQGKVGAKVTKREGES